MTVSLSYVRANFEKGVEQTLKQVFLLDCVTRTEGVYDIEPRARSDLEPILDIDWAALYDRPPAEQVATYLEVPYALVSDSIPEWRLTVHVEPTTETVEQVPFVVDDLAIVRSADTSPTASPARPEMTGLSRNDIITRSAAETGGTRNASYVQPESDSSNRTSQGRSSSSRRSSSTSTNASRTCSATTRPIWLANPRGPSPAIPGTKPRSRRRWRTTTMSPTPLRSSASDRHPTIGDALHPTVEGSPTHDRPHVPPPPPADVTGATGRSFPR